MTNNFPLESADAIAIPVRLLSSVAVVGRDNEPIYLRGDLCDCNAIIASSSSSSSSPTAAASSPKAVTTQHTAADGASSSVNTDDEDGNDAKNDDGGGEDNDDEGDGASPQSHGRRGESGNNSGKGLFGRIKGVVGRNNNSNDGKEGPDGILVPVRGWWHVRVTQSFPLSLPLSSRPAPCRSSPFAWPN